MNRLGNAALALIAVVAGWCAGVIAAYVLAGSEFGQAPVMTVPFGILIALGFAFWPRIPLWFRLLILFGAILAPIDLRSVLRSA